MTKQLILIISVIGFVFFSGPVTVFSQSYGNPDAIISRVWLERVDELLDGDYNQDELSEAAEALETASEFSAPGRDSLYLEARLLLAGYQQKLDETGESPARTAFELLEMSLEDKTPSSSSDISSFEERAVLWSAQALRLREYRSLLNRYLSWPGGHRDDPVLLYAAARAALYLGLEHQSAVLAARGEALSINGTDLKRLGSVYSTSAQPAFRALAVASGDKDSIETLDAAWRRWGNALEEALQPWLFSGYIDAGSTGNLAELLSPDTLLVLDLLSNTRIDNLPSVYLNDLALVRMIQAENPGSLQIGNHTGIMISDADYDGYPEEYLRLVNGKPDYRKLDSDQDGRFEWYVTYNGYAPWHLQLDNGSMDVVYEQDAYPSILNINRRIPGSQIMLSMHPGGFSWECEGPEGIWADPLTPDWNESDLWFGTRTVTVNIVSPDKKITGETRTYLSRGYPLRAEEKQFPVDRPEDLLWLREIIYEDGVPVAGRRTYNVRSEKSESLEWELYERFENGEMVGLAWDPGMTGTPAYLRDWALDRYLETQIWDLDADQWIDARRFISSGTGSSAEELLITEARIEDLIPWEASDWAPWD